MTRRDSSSMGSSNGSRTATATASSRRRVRGDVLRGLDTPRPPPRLLTAAAGSGRAQRAFEQLDTALATCLEEVNLQLKNLTQTVTLFRFKTLSVRYERCCRRREHHPPDTFGVIAHTCARLPAATFLGNCVASVLLSFTPDSRRNVFIHGLESTQTEFAVNRGAISGT
jgi:hypothetical protein